MLDSDNWRELSSLFDEFTGLPPGDRDPWLARLFARDASLHERLIRLLKADAGAESANFLGQLPTVERTGDLPQPEADFLRKAGDLVGPYRLERELGRGGMGTVWLAERSDGTFKRAVALKLPHLGIRDRVFRERFDRERDILAALTHPKIARLYDAGVTADGQPFLALEYVSGVPIGDYSNEQALGLTARIELFLQVVDTIHFAHRNLVVHRDIKPSNVLVTADGSAMLLDFGIAKLLETGGGVSGASDATDLDGSPMTPRYASPEQVDDGPVTTGSDVYSLGVMLFELLSGRLPYRGDVGTRVALKAAIAAGDTLPPSRAADSKAEPPRGLPDRKRLARALKGDLDGILLKALEKDPALRYPSAEALARDLARYVNGEPVEARPYSRIYRARKFVRRHRIGVGVAATVAVAILGSLTFAIVQLRAARRERDRAEHVSSFLVDLFKVSDPNEAKGKAVTAREILDRGVAKIDDTLKDEPLVQAELLVTMGEVYQNLGLYKSALPMLEKSLALHRRLVGSDDYETMEVINDLATLLQNQGQLDRAEELFREALERRRRVLGNAHKDTLNAMNNLALTLQLRGKLAEAEPLFRESLDGKRRTLKANDADILPPINNLAMLFKQEGKLEEAKPYMLELVEKAPKILGDDDPHVMTAISNLALLLSAEGNLAEAEPRFREALAGRRRLLGNEHPQTLMTLTFLGDCLRERGRLAEAEQCHREALEGLRRVVGPDHPRTLGALNSTGRLLQEQGKLVEAERCFREVAERRTAKLGVDHTETIESTLSLGGVLARQGKLAEAEAIDREALERSRRALGAENPTTIDAVITFGALRTAEGHADEAEPLLRGAVATLRRTFPAMKPLIGQALLSHGRCLTALGRYDEAEAALVESSKILSTSSPVHAPAAASALEELHNR